MLVPNQYTDLRVTGLLQNEIGQYGFRYFSCLAPGSIAMVPDVRGKEVCIVIRLNIAYKPAVHILVIYASGSGFSV